MSTEELRHLSYWLAGAVIVLYFMFFSKGGKE